MRYLSYVLLWLCCVYGPASGAAQTAPGVAHIYAFVTLHQPGNIAVDPATGRPFHEGPDSLYTVYVETNGRPVRWTAAYIDGRLYTVSERPLEKTPYEAGTGRQSGRKIILTAAKGNRLWRLDLSPAEQQAARKKDKTGRMILEGKRGNKKIVLRTDRPVELESIPSV